MVWARQVVHDGMRKIPESHGLGKGSMRQLKCARFCSSPGRWRRWGAQSGDVHDQRSGRREEEERLMCGSHLSAWGKMKGESGWASAERKKREGGPTRGREERVKERRPLEIYRP